MPNWNDSNRFDQNNNMRGANGQDGQSFGRDRNEEFGRSYDQNRDQYRGGANRDDNRNDNRNVDRNYGANDRGFGVGYGTNERDPGRSNQSYSSGGNFYSGRENDSNRDVRSYGRDSNDFRDQNRGADYGSYGREERSQRDHSDYTTPGYGTNASLGMGTATSSFGSGWGPANHWGFGGGTNAGNTNQGKNYAGSTYETGYTGSHAGYGNFGGGQTFGANQSTFGNQNQHNQPQPSYGHRSTGFGAGSGSSYGTQDYGMRQSHTGKGPKGWKRSDERIKEEVCDVLERHPDIDASEIEVDVKEGAVVLRGHVDNRQTKRMAEDAVEHLNGVKDVRNELTVNQSLFERAKEMITGESSTKSKSSPKH